MLRAKLLKAVDGSWSRPVLPETIAFASLCVLDMASTIFVVRSGVAIEANPFLAPLLARGVPVLAFTLAKTVSFLLPLVLIEMIRPLAPDFIRRSLQIGTVGYIALYLLGTFGQHLVK